MEFVMLLIFAAFVAHGIDVVRDEHGHARSSAAQQLRADHPDRSEGWVKRHAWYRAIAHWPQIPRAVAQAWREDRAYIRLRRTQGDVGHLRRMRQWREELKRAEAERKAEAAAAVPAVASGDGTPESPVGRHRKDPEAVAPAVTPGEVPGERSADTSPVPEDDPFRGVTVPVEGYPPEWERPGGFVRRAPGEPDPRPGGDYGRPGPETPVTFGPDGAPEEQPRPNDTADPAASGPEGVPTNEGDGMTTGTTNGTPTGEAPSYDDAKGNASNWLSGFGQQLSALEQHQTDIATAGDLAGDQNVMGPLDQALEHVRAAADAMNQHLIGLNQHQPGQEYADSVAAPADTSWLKSQ